MKIELYDRIKNMKITSNYETEQTIQSSPEDLCLAINT